MDLDPPDITMGDSDEEPDIDDAYSTRDGFDESQIQEISSRAFTPSYSIDDQDSPDIEILQSSCSLQGETQTQGLQEGAATCSSYDIVPYVAAPHSTSVNAIAATSFMKWIFTGGQDGYIRRFDFYASMLGRSLLTVAQRHPYVDSVTKAGVLLSYWENEEPPEETSTPVSSYQLSNPRLSPVYCLAVHSQAVWILSGLESGGINLQSVRHEEGKIIATLRGHGGPVSVLSLASDERSVLSGGWDRVVNEWDLDTGQTIRSYSGHIGQISSINRRSATSPLLMGQVEMKDKDTPESYDPLFDDSDDEIENTSRQTGKSTKNSPTTIEPQNEREVFLVSGIDGTLLIWDPRKSDPIHRFPVPTGTPPWCMNACWSIDGQSIFVGRRNQTVHEWSVHRMSDSPRVLKLPANSGPVSCVEPMPNGRHIVCASNDNVRLYDVSHQVKGPTPFLIVPGHHGGVVSSIYIDPTCQFMLSAGGSRGWEGFATEVLLGYEINVIS